MKHLDGALTAVFPLYDLCVDDPKRDEGERHGIRILRRTAGMKVHLLRRSVEDTERSLSLDLKDEIVLICSNLASATQWKTIIEDNVVLDQDVNDAIDHSNDSSLQRNRTFSMGLHRAFNSKSAVAEDSVEHSILSTLILPTAMGDHEKTETLKIEIAKTLSMKWAR